MKRYLLIFIVLYSVLTISQSCKPNNPTKAKASPPGINMSEILLSTITPMVTQRISTPTPQPLPTFTITPTNILKMDFQSATDLRGKLLIRKKGPSYNNFIVIDFDSRQSTLFRMPLERDCGVLSDNETLLCGENGQSFLYHWIMREAELLPTNGFDYCFLMPAKDALFCLMENVDKTFSISLYNIEDMQTQVLGSFDSTLWDDLPSPSVSGNYLLGIWVESNKHPTLDLVNVKEKNIKTVYSSDDIWPSGFGNISWSPVFDIAVIGITHLEFVDPDGCSSYGLMLYDPEKNVVKIFSPVEKDFCFRDFYLSVKNHRTDIWSPDGTKVALISSRPALCIFDIGVLSRNCVQIDDEYQGIENIFWSPDSNYVALITSSKDLCAFNVNELSKACVHIDNELDSLYDMVWSPDSKLLIYTTELGDMNIFSVAEETNFNLIKSNNLLKHSEPIAWNIR